MSFGQQVEVIAPVLAVGFGVGLVRRARPAIGWTLVGSGSLAAVVLALLGSLRPLVGLVGITAFLFALEVDRPGAPARRALALLSISVGFLALMIAALYT